MPIRTYTTKSGKVHTYHYPKYTYSPHKRRRARKNYQRRHPARHRSNARTQERRKRARARAFIRAYLSEHPCVEPDCGESDPDCLDFDHRDPALKSFNISRAVGNGTALPAIIAEIAKCDVRCANCHRKRTKRERHWAGRHTPTVVTSSKDSFFGFTAQLELF